MAKCKLCKVNIPDGTEYCSSCQDKGNVKANESYLDSLLNSVKNTAPASEGIYKKKDLSEKYTERLILEEKAEQAVSEKKADEDIEDFGSYDIDLSDIEDFDQFYEGDLDDTSIGDEELFGENLADIFEDNPADRKTINNTVREEVKPETKSPDDIKPLNINLKDNREENLLNEEETVPLESLAGNFTSDEISEAQEEEEEAAEEEEKDESYEDEENELDPDINELLNSLNLEDSYTPSASNASVPRESIAKQGESDEEETDDFEPLEEDDFLNLVNQLSSDDPVTADVMAINDLLNGRPVEETKKPEAPSNVGEVFSDALKVVSSLNDPSIDEEELLNRIPDSKENRDDKKKRQKKEFKKEIDLTEEEVKPKKSLFKRLFSNVPDEKAAAKKAKTQITAQTESASEKVKTKKAKGKGKKGAVNEAEEEQTGSGKVKPSAAKGEETKEIKKDKKEKKKKTKEIIQVIDEIEEDEGRINRLGAGIVFVFFGLLVLLLLVGTNVVSYTLSIQHATAYFSEQKYNDAYNEVYGMDIKAEDIVLYDRIMTVQFVNKQLNSYNNYYYLKEYPKALDSLLKGLNKYDKYIELATMLGIKTDLDYVRSQILAELNNVFNLTEKEAMQIIATEDRKEYSLEVYNAVLEKMNN